MSEQEKIDKFIGTWRTSETTARYYLKLFDWNYDYATAAYWREHILPL